MADDYHRLMAEMERDRGEKRSKGASEKVRREQLETQETRQDKTRRGDKEKKKQRKEESFIVSAGQYNPFGFAVCVCVDKWVSVMFRDDSGHAIDDAFLITFFCNKVSSRQRARQRRNSVYSSFVGCRPQLNLLTCKDRCRSVCITK